MCVLVGGGKEFNRQAVIVGIDDRQLHSQLGQSHFLCFYSHLSCMYDVPSPCLRVCTIGMEPAATRRQEPSVAGFF